MSEQIREIHVKRGQRVTAGEALVSLDSERLVSERDLATALLQEAKAKKERLRNGYLPSEIETARQQYQASMEEVAGAEKAYDRALKLRQQNAISQQSIDDLYSQLNSLRAKANAARSSFETLDAPPRDDELLAAEAAVGAAQARLRIAQISLDRAVIYAPASGRILALEARIGELTSPDSSEPLVVLSDTSNLRAVAEVDEYDALRVRLGQVCEIRSDAADGVIARGKVVEIEPQMNPKRMFGQWAGERTDTFSRRVWIELESSGDNDLPIGLPVDVYIHAEVSP
jgi:multidrug resistance efflux pump